MAFYTFCTILMVAVGYFVVQSGFLALRVHQLAKSKTIDNCTQIQELIDRFQRVSELGIESRQTLMKHIQEYREGLESLREVCKASLGGLKEVSAELAKCTEEIREVKHSIDFIVDEYATAGGMCDGLCVHGECDKKPATCEQNNDAE